MSETKIYHVLKIGSQPELEAKIDEFINLSGSKILLIDPMRGPVDVSPYLPHQVMCPRCGWIPFEGMSDYLRIHYPSPICLRCEVPLPAPSLEGVLVDFDDGPNAHPGHPDWVRKVRDDCAASETLFFFNGWGEWGHETQANYFSGSPGDALSYHNAMYHLWPDGTRSYRIGVHRTGRLLDGRIHNDKLVSL